MVDAILDGISRALADGFPACRIYGDERVRQGLKTPGFFVGLGTCKQRQLPGGMMQLRQSVEVTYFPEGQGDYKELWAVGTKALGLLDTLTLPDGSMVRGTTKTCDTGDGLMHLRATYTLRLKPTETSELMGDITIQM
ncbi:MAG: hypothetical protein FWC72_01680 [Oscillospiraceae bacterium]|nr:hypothetical protein [Oscillospiraceae bacterium]